MFLNTNRGSGERNRLCGTDWYCRELICRGPETDTAASDAHEARCASVSAQVPQRSVIVREVRRVQDLNASIVLAIERRRRVWAAGVFVRLSAS